MSDSAFRPLPDDNQWFTIGVARPAGPGADWPAGPAFLSRARFDAPAFQAFMVVADADYYPNRAAGISIFTWEAGGDAGNYLRDQDGWYLGFDRPTKCLCRRSKGLSSFWEMQQQDGASYLRDISAEGCYVSWMPEQDLPLAISTLFVSEQPGRANALTVSLTKAAPPVRD